MDSTIETDVSHLYTKGKHVLTNLSTACVLLGSLRGGSRGREGLESCAYPPRYAFDTYRLFRCDDARPSKILWSFFPFSFPLLLLSCSPHLCPDQLCSSPHILVHFLARLREIPQTRLSNLNRTGQHPLISFISIFLSQSLAHVLVERIFCVSFSVMYSYVSPTYPGPFFLLCFAFLPSSLPFFLSSSSFRL